MTNIPALLAVDWRAPANVRAVCTMRAGGVSIGPYASLNLADHVDDDPQALASNRARLRSALRLPREPIWLRQVHGIEVFDADAVATASGSPPQADAAVTREPGPVLAVLVADCMPVLLCRRDGRGVAIAHAGWRGLAAGVVEAAVQALGAEAGQVMAWLGPAIGPAQFEVGDEVRAAFCARTASANAAFARNERGRWQCDLHALATQRLQAAGVTSVFGERLCTYRKRERFFSFRRDRVTGRFAALIWMTAARAP